MKKMDTKINTKIVAAAMIIFNTGNSISNEKCPIIN